MRRTVAIALRVRQDRRDRERREAGECKDAGDKDVDVSGAEVGQQSIRAGLVDEISMRLVPVLISSGTRMFEHPGDGRIQPATVWAIETAAATHLRFRIAS